MTSSHCVLAARSLFFVSKALFLAYPCSVAPRIALNPFRGRYSTLFPLCLYSRLLLAPLVSSCLLFLSCRLLFQFVSLPFLSTLLTGRISNSTNPVAYGVPMTLKGDKRSNWVSVMGQASHPTSYKQNHKVEGLYIIFPLPLNPCPSIKIFKYFVCSGLSHITMLRHTLQRAINMDPMM